MNSDLNCDLNVVSNVILSFAKNGVSSSNSESICALTPTVSSSMSENISEFSSDTVGKRNLNTLSEFNTPTGPSFVFNKVNQDNISITQPVKRTNTFTFFDDDKRTKFNDFNRINVLADSVDQMMKKINSLETKYNELLVINKEIERNNKSMYDNQAILNIEIKELQTEKFDLYAKYQSLLDQNSKTAKEVESIKSNEVVMCESGLQSTSKLYSEVFKINNNKMSEPLQEIMKVVANNEEDKRKREKNLLLFGLKVKDSDINFSTVKKLLNDIGIDQKCVHSAFYLNSKSDTSIIKLVTKDTFSKNLILNASKNLKKINLSSKTKISICQDLSLVDRQIHKNLVIRRNELNINLKTNDDHYFGIRNNNVVRINKPKL